MYPFRDIRSTNGNHFYPLKKSIAINTIKFEWFTIQFKGSNVRVLNLVGYLYLNTIFILPNHADTDKMTHSALSDY